MSDPTEFSHRILRAMGNVMRMEALSAARRAKPGGVFFDSPPEPAFDRLTHLVTLTLGVPVALLSLVDGERVYYKSAVGLEEAPPAHHDISLDRSLCRHVAATGMRLMVNDTRNDRRLSGSRSALDLNIVAYAGVPVRAPNGHVIAALAAIDDAPRAWSARDADILEGLARSVESEFALRDWLTTSEAARRQADELAETRRAIVTMCNHELRNPLNGIMGGVALLKRQTNEQARQGAITIIEDASRLMLDMIEKTLDEDASGGGALADVDLRALLEHRIELTRQAVGDREIAVTQTIGDDVPATIRSNALLLHRIVGNLLDNAAKYTDRGRIAVDVRRVGSDLTLRVRDTGRGIAATDAARVFGRYERADTGEGFGLGLTIAREAARALDGDLRLETSAAGRGSTFTLTLPISDAEPGEEA